MLPTVKWYIGQSLLPENWHLMNDSLTEYTFDLINIFNNNMFGISSLEIDLKMLEYQIFRIKSLQLFLPTGEFYDLNVNASSNNLDLSKISDSEVSIYINIKDTNPVDYNYRGTNIKTHHFLLELSTDKLTQSNFCFKLCELYKDADDSWSINYQYIPPSFSLSHTLGHTLGSNIILLLDRIIEYYNSLIETSETLISKRLEFRPCVEVSFELKNILNSQKTNIKNLHPNTIFRYLYCIYVKISLFFNFLPDTDVVYDHYALAKSLYNLIKKIEKYLEKNSYSYDLNKFVVKDNYLQIDSIPDQHLNLEKVFLIVQLPSKDVSFDIGKIKITSSSRFQTVNNKALNGIPIEKINKLPINVHFNSYCHFYRFLPGKEWDFVVNDKSIFISRNKSYEKNNFYLCHIK